MIISNIYAYLKAVMLTLLLMLPMQVEAGTWSYRCELLVGNRVSCDEIASWAKRSVTDAFTSMYPDDKYLILFTATASQYGAGSFSYSMIAALHEVRDDKGRLLKFSSIALHSSTGYHPNPSYAYQGKLLLKAAEKATAGLVSNVTGR